jgi:DNA repair exonuclease SbcCD ATPase subunit
MPKRILIPMLITTGVIGLGAGAIISTPLLSHAQDNNTNNTTQDNQFYNGGGMMDMMHMGKRPRSNDFAYAKSLGVDTSKVEEAQTKVKDAEANLRTEMQNVRSAIKDAIIKKAEDKKVDQKIIDDFKNASQKLTDDKKALEDALANKDTTIQTIKDLRQKVRDDMKAFKDSEKAIKDAIK